MSTITDILEAYTSTEKIAQLNEITFDKNTIRDKSLLLTYLENMAKTYLFEIKDNSKKNTLDLLLTDFKLKSDIEEILAYTKFDENKFSPKIFKFDTDNKTYIRIQNK